MTTEIRSKDGKTLFALLLDLSDISEGTLPTTDPSWSLQILMMKRRRGHVVGKHMHKKILKTTKQPQEALVVVKGALEARMFDRKGQLVGKTNVGAGQCLLILDGAHEIEMKKDTLAYAFKDGPHIKEDKILL